MRHRRDRFRLARGAGKDGSTQVKVWARGRAKVRRRVCRLAVRGIGNARLMFVSDGVRAGLGAGGFPLLLAKPGGVIDCRVNRWRGGFLLGGRGATVVVAIRDQAFDGDDHGEGFDLGGHAVSSHVGVQVGDFPEAGQDSFAALIQPALLLKFLLQEAIMRGRPVLEHVGADPGFGFGVGGGVGVETGGFGSLVVDHSSRENQVGKDYFLISNEVADLIFGHKWLRLLGVVRLRERSCAQRPLSSVKHGGSPCSDFLSCLKSSMAFACAQGGIRCSRQLSWLNSKVSADEGCFQALNLSTHRSIIGRSTAQHIIRTVVLIHLGVISYVAHLACRASRTTTALYRSSSGWFETCS